MIEHDLEHPLLRLLDLRLADAATVDARASTRDEWREEAQRLERQGKQEQAEAIRRQVLGEQPVPWTVLAGDKLAELDAKAFQPNSPFTKARQQLLDFGCVHGDESLVAHLAAVGFAPAAPLAERPYCTRVVARAPGPSSPGPRRSGRARSPRSSARRRTRSPPSIDTASITARCTG